MSRLTYVPPFLMDMPFINDTRLPPGGVGYSDPLAVAAEMPVYNAFFDTWSGLNDGPEQTHDPLSAWDFDSYYDDETFWGVAVRSGGTGLIFTKKTIAADGSLVTTGTYDLDTNSSSTWPQGKWVGSTSAADTESWQIWQSQTIAAVRADKNRFIVFPATYFPVSNNYSYAALVFDISTGAPVRSSMLHNSAMRRDGSGVSTLYYPDVHKVTDNIFALNTYVGDASTQLYVSMFNVKNNRAAGYAAVQFSTTSQSDPSVVSTRLSPGRIVFAGKGSNHGYVTSFTELTFNTNDDSTASPSFGVAGFTLGGNDADPSEIYHARTHVFLTPSLLVQSLNGAGTLGLFNYSAGAVQLLSSLAYRPPLPTSYGPAGIARLNNREFLIVHADAADNNRIKHRTQRVSVNSDNTMTLGQAVTNYQTAPFSNSPVSALPSSRMNNRGLTLPGNRVLMQHRRRHTDGSAGAHQRGTIVTKLLRAA